MQFEKEIQRAVKHQTYIGDGERKTEEELTQIANSVINDIQNKNGSSLESVGDQRI